MPPHLRRALFALHPDLRAAGRLPSLDLPHHLRPGEWCRFREGVALAPGTTANGDAANGAAKKKSRREKKQPCRDGGPATTLVDAGLPDPIPVAGAVPPNVRATLRFVDPKRPKIWPPTEPLPDTAAVAVAPSAPREEEGWYWGYNVRGAGSLSGVLTEAPWEEGYNVVVGTSERGRPLEELLAEAEGKGGSRGSGEEPAVWRTWQHMLVLFGGVGGLEAAVGSDAELRAKGVTRPEELCDAWVDVCPRQGSRTIRTEEAVWIGLMGLRELVKVRAEAERSGS